MTVKINRNSGSTPRPLAEKLVAGQALPFVASLTHKHNKPLVVPSSGINTPIAPGEAVNVKVKSLDQAWLLVTDLAELAHRADNDADDFAVLVAPEVVAEPAAPAETKGKTKAVEAK